MTLLTGKFEHEKSENLDKYYQAVGVPFIVRKVLINTKPVMEFTRDGDNWELATKSTFSSSSVKFRLGEEYDDPVPGIVMKSVTTLKDNNQLTTISIRPDGQKVVRIYNFSESQCIMVLFDEKSGVEGKRFFKRVA